MFCVQREHPVAVKSRVYTGYNSIFRAERDFTSKQYILYSEFSRRRNPPLTSPHPTLDRSTSEFYCCQTRTLYLYLARRYVSLPLLPGDNCNVRKLPATHICGKPPTPIHCSLSSCPPPTFANSPPPHLLYSDTDLCVDRV